MHPDGLRTALTIVGAGAHALSCTGDYVLSFKPSPRAQGVSHPEVIMKDISTVCYKPERLWDCARIALEAVQESA